MRATSVNAFRMGEPKWSEEVEGEAEGVRR
jgi:hypothetical protein